MSDHPDLFSAPEPSPPPKSPAPKLEASWLAVLRDEFDKPYMGELRQFLAAEKKQYTVYPPGRDMFNAFRQTPIDNVKVVILGQDPYHGPNQAHGLCFSVVPDVPPPPSLLNIFRELETDLQLPMPPHGNLTAWAQEGVFLLNTSLSVRAGQAGSHAGKGWEVFTNQVIAEVNARCSNVVFMLWGRPAQGKAKMVDAGKHLILAAPHPSPLSAHRGFLGCRHFLQANAYLESHGKAPIDWQVR